MQDSLAGHGDLEARDAAHVQPGAVGAADEPQQHRVAGGTAGHHPGGVRVDTCLRDGPAGTARHAREGRAGDVHTEQLAQRPAEHVPVHVVAHGLPPEGPKRSVLMAPVPWSARTSRSAPASTNPVGPHTNTAGDSSGGHPAEARVVALIRPVGWPEPGGAVRVYTYPTSRPSPACSRRASSSAYSRAAGSRTE